MSKRNSAVVVLISLALASTGCSTRFSPQNILNSIFTPEEEVASIAPCLPNRPDRLRLIPLDSRWVIGDLDCPTTGESTIAFTTETRSPQLTSFEIEILSGNGTVTVVRRDDQGKEFTYARNSTQRSVLIPSFQLTPSSRFFVASDGPLRFRIRRKPSARRVIARPAPQPRTPPAEETPVEIPQDAPDTPAVPPPPGFVRVGLKTPIAARSRELVLDRGTNAGLLVGQQGHVLIGGERVARFCVAETSARSARAKLSSAIDLSGLSDDAPPLIEVETRSTRGFGISRVVGNPADEFHLKGGRNACLRTDMAGSIRIDGETVTRFTIGRVVQDRAWAHLEDPIDPARAAAASVLLELGSPPGDAN